MNGVTGTRPNAPFVGTVPTGKRATVDEIENDLPNYATEPKVWEHAMRPRMYTVLKAHGIASPTVTTPIITAALAAAKEKKPGDVRTAWQMLAKERRAALKAQREYAAEKRRISEIRDWLIGPCGLPTPTVREMMKQSGTELQDRPLIERITDITMMAIDRQFNAHGQNKKHWAANYANPPVADFWQHVTGVAEENDWGLQERIGKLNIALGSVASIYWYPGTLEQARAAFDKTYCDKGDDEMGEAIKQQEATVELPDYAHDKTKLVNALPRHMMKRLNITDISGDMKACFPGGLATTIGADGPESAYQQAETYINERLAARFELDKVFPRDANNQPVDDPAPLQAAASALPKAPETQQAPTAPVAASDGSEVSERANSELVAPARPVVVNPTVQPSGVSHNEMSEAAFVMLMSLYAPNGAEMKFTIRAMSADELAERIDALVAVFSKRGYKAQRADAPSAPTSQTQQSAPVLQPASAPAPTNGLPPVAPAPVASQQPAGQQSGTYRIGAIKKVVDEGKTRYELYGGVNDEKPLLTARLDGVVAQCIAPYIDINAMQVGTRYQIVWDADWKLGKVNQTSGRQYKDLMTVRPVAQATAA